jgi:hypothetical protein
MLTMSCPMPTFPSGCLYLEVFQQPGSASASSVAGGSRRAPRFACEQTTAWLPHVGPTPPGWRAPMSGRMGP